MQCNGNVPVPYYTSFPNINNAGGLFFAKKEYVVIENENCKQISSDRYYLCSRQHQASPHV